MSIRAHSYPSGGGRPPGAGRHRALTGAVGAAAIASVLALAAGPAHAGTGAAARPPTGPAAAAALTATPVKAPTAPQSVTLVTGDKVTVTTVGGKPSYAVSGPAGAAEEFISFQGAGGDHYVVPAEARPYLGHQLDLSLFDVTALIRAGLTTGARVPVALAFAAGSTPAAPPGVTLTSTSGQSAQGYVATGPAASGAGAAFAAGLKAATTADLDAGHQPGTAPLFGGLASLSVAGSGLSPFTGSAGATTSATAPNSITPLYKEYILQINAVGMDGNPDDNGAIQLVNTDSLDKQDIVVWTSGGIARIALPAGHYSIAGLFYDPSATGPGTVRLVGITDFKVAASATATSVTLDERTATNQVTFSTPRPATADYLLTTWSRADPLGDVAQLSMVSLGTLAPTYTNSAPAAKVGTADLSEQWGGAGTAPGTPYRYDLSFDSDRIPAKEAFAAKPAQLATVDQQIYNDPASAGGSTFLDGAFDALGQNSGLASGGELYAGPFVQYLGTATGGQWLQYYSDPANSGFMADPHTYTGGKTYTVEWAHGPLAPTTGNHTGTSDFPCLACASGGDLSAGFIEIGDSDPSHFSESSENTDYSLYVNGTQEFTGTDDTGAGVTGLPATPSVIREVFDTDATGLPGVTQSLVTHTDLSFTDTPGTGDTLPGDVLCDGLGQVASPCEILPALSLDYHLGTDFLNTSKPGLQSLGLTVDHLSYDGYGSQASITSASVSVSFDGGATWQPALVLGTNGSYTAAWTNPASAAGTSPELKVTATDSAGGSITQTVTAAYTVAAPAN